MSDSTKDAWAAVLEKWERMPRKIIGVGGITLFNGIEVDEIFERVYTGWIDHYYNALTPYDAETLGASYFGDKFPMVIT